MNLLRSCNFAWPGTYGHECGKPAVFAGLKRSDMTRDGIYWSRRCAECKDITGGENAGIERFEPLDPQRHRNRWKINQQQLIDWINTHDCGVTPTAVLRDGDIVIRVDQVSATGEHSTLETVVHSHAEAREALGY
jgi:hypothetical protein